MKNGFLETLQLMCTPWLRQDIQGKVRLVRDLFASYMFFAIVVYLCYIGHSLKLQANMTCIKVYVGKVVFDWKNKGSRSFMHSDEWMKSSKVARWCLDFSFVTGKCRLYVAGQQPIPQFFVINVFGLSPYCWSISKLVQTYSYAPLQILDSDSPTPRLLRKL